MQADIQNTLSQIQERLSLPFYKDAGYWIALVVSLVGLGFAVLAWLEAGHAKDEATEAKKAAYAAGRRVRLQSVTLELYEIIKQLAAISMTTRWEDARSLLNQTSWRVRMAVSPFARETASGGTIQPALQAIDAAQASLTKVRPTDATKENEAPNAVFFAVEADFRTLTDCVADLIGQIDNEQFHFGDDNAGKS